MHGTIELQSQLGSGTQASFSIPFNRPQLMDKSTPLISLEYIPERLQDDPSMSSHMSDHATPPQTPPATLPSTSMGQQMLSQRAAVQRASFSRGSGESTLSEEERKRFHILVVEDNAINQQIALKTIRKLGFSVNAVWNGKEALEYLLRGFTEDNPKPDVILMDVQMPILDGYRATHLIRHHNPYSSLPGMGTVPIVAMTASAIQGDREKCQRAGMNDYLSKPVKAKVLEQMLVKWALKSKQLTQFNYTLQSHHTDHDSNCTDNDPYMDDAEAVMLLGADKSMQGDAAQFAASHPGLPGTESEGEREMRRVVAAEKAESLRNDKLFIASNREAPHQQHVGRVERPLLQPSRTALTEANIGQFSRQQATSSDTAAHEALSNALPHTASIDLIKDEVSCSLSSDTKLQNDPSSSLDGRSTRSHAMSERIPIQRHSSGTSQSTITGNFHN
jgi:CheY-like chemotaxis protein